MEGSRIFCLAWDRKQKYGLQVETYNKFLNQEIKEKLDHKLYYYKQKS